NPARLNALDLAMWERLGGIARTLDADESVRCVVVRGAGEKAFAAGADIAAFATERANSTQAKEYGRRIAAAMHSFAACRHRVVADDKVVEEAYASARRIAEGAPLAARWHKKFVRRLAEARPLSEAEYDESYACFDTADFREGVAAFLAKRKPQFKGR